ncbi:hypothetical protein JS756_10990 [Streptomyces actuosus]|uniref:Uncharacterized protein n=1 Tax=Streptomyces actuosus TaxID=1885 RepID=A0ABS2VND8_STRAS|nr:hypothetical protein [Streptomyces actuosus]
MWPFALAGSLLVLAVLGAAGAWMFVVRGMSDPVPSVVLGIRIEASGVSVKAPTCPTDRVGRVEVHDSDSERLLWWADGPTTPEGVRGAVTLWTADGFRSASPRTRPEPLAAFLDVSVVYAGGDDGTGDVFDVRAVRAAHVPAGRYWTRDGPRTAAQIDAQLNCRGAS